MHFKQLASRLTGLSCPIFGVSWNPPEAERTVARRVITALEDRRVLYVDSEMEVPSYCVQSVLQIRELLTQEIAPLAQDSQISQSLRAMRAACRQFLGKVNGDEGRIITFGASQGHYASWTFNAALGILRGVFGVHVAKLAAAYGLDVEDELASILPGEDGAR
ncbi:MAG TPA: DUF6650 family protein [Planctomycetota bacterium]|nr:DUF6650 family protein [Planctomycetota bacterium]